jgi:hypothetical protein
MAATVRDPPDAAKPFGGDGRRHGGSADGYAAPVTNRPLRPGGRRAALALALTPAVVLLGASGTAAADAPATWESTSGISPTYVILVLIAIPVALFLLITLLVYLPSMRRGDQSPRGEAWRGQSEWYGGPRGGLEAADRTAPPAAVTDGRGAAARGGSSGRW